MDTHRSRRLRQLSTFYALTFASSWLLWLPAILFFRNPNNQNGAAIPLHLVLAAFLGVFVPTLVALLLTGVQDGKRGVQVLLGRCLHWRVGLVAIVIVVLRGGNVYTPAQRQRILAYAQQQPDREADGTATWSLSTLRRTLRAAPDGCDQLNTATIHTVLREAGWRWQCSRSWCKTGTSLRRCTSGVGEVVDSDAEAKKA